MVKVTRLWPTIADDTPLEKAEEIRKVARPSDFRLGCMTEDEFVNIRIPDPKFILRGLMTEKSITLVNGSRGSGKSWLMEAIANGVTWGSQVGPWGVEKPVNVLFVDGEMSMWELQKRFKMMNRGMNIDRKPCIMYLYPESYAYRIGLNRASILDPAWREFIKDAAFALNIGLLVLDNLSSLAPGIDENDKMSFDPVNRWLMELRSNDVSTIMSHHTGKSGEQRGTTAHEDHIDVAILINETPEAKQTKKCEFVCRPTKDRASITGGEAYKMKLEEEGGRMQFTWEDANNKFTRGELKCVADKYIEMFESDPAITWQEARETYGISKAHFYRAKRLAQGSK